MAVYLYDGTPIDIEATATLRYVAVDRAGFYAEGSVEYVIRPPFFFTTAPFVQTLTSDGAIIGYGTADSDAEDLSVTATAFATVTELMTLRDAAQTIINAGVSVTDTRKMIEAVLSTAQFTVTVAEASRRIEAAAVDVTAAASVTDAFQLVENLVTTFTAITSGAQPPFSFTQQPVVAGYISGGVIISYGTLATGSTDYAEQLETSVTGTVSVTDLLTRLEAALTAIEAVTTVQDALLLAENLITEATVQTSALSGASELLNSYASAAATVEDLQLMVDNVTALATAGATLTDIAAYLDELTVTAGATTTVTDFVTGLILDLLGMEGFFLPHQLHGFALAPGDTGFILSDQKRGFLL